MTMISRLRLFLFSIVLFDCYYPYFQSDCYSVMIVIVTASRDTPRGVSVYLKQMLKTPRHLCPLIIIRIERLSLSSQTYVNYGETVDLYQQEWPMHYWF